jgi:hypothetical protein
MMKPPGRIEHPRLIERQGVADVPEQEIPASEIDPALVQSGGHLSIFSYHFFLSVGVPIFENARQLYRYSNLYQNDRFCNPRQGAYV